MSAEKLEFAIHRFWMNLQAHYDLEVEKDRLGSRLDREVQPRKAAG